MLPDRVNHSRMTELAAYRESTPVGFMSSGYVILRRRPTQGLKSVSWETPCLRERQDDRFRSTAAGSQAGIRFAAENSSSGEEHRAELRQFSGRQAADTRYAETMGRETGLGILRRRSGSRPTGKRFSSSSSDELDFDESPHRRRVSLTPSRFELPNSRWPSDSRPAVKRMIMKPPNFNGNGFVMTFLAKFDNCEEYSSW